MKEKMKLLIQLINQHSGGAKLMELIPDLLELGFTKKEILLLDKYIPKYPEYGLKVLYYTWHDCNREKIFIYTP
jgi:hypothetical protein